MTRLKCTQFHLQTCLHLLYLFCLTKSAILSPAGALYPEEDSEDYGTHLNSIDIDIHPGSKLTQYDEEGIWICPETFDLNFDLEKKPFIIHLVRTPGTRSTKVPIYVTAENYTQRYHGKITKQYCNYLDIGTSSSFTISLENSNYIFDGTFREKGKLFGIRPDGFNSRRSKRSTSNTKEHSLFLLSQEENYSEAEFVHTRSKRQIKDRYTVEVLVVIDNSIYEKFKSSSTANTDEEITRETVEKVAYHFSHIMNGVSMRFSGIVDQDYEISIELVSFIMSKSTSTSPWTDPQSERDDLTTVLISFQRYMNDIFPLLVNLPEYDHAVLFTGKDLHNIIGGPTLSAGLLGGSTIAGACSYQKMSAIESKDMFTTTFAAAHELAHNLGAYHDGEHNECLASKMNLMAPNKQIRTKANYRNIYLFSTCSKRELKTGLKNISQTDSCLFRTTKRDKTEYETHLVTPPGQRYTLDQQCKAVVGPDSYFCSRDVDELCSQLSCWFKDANGCGTYKDQPADQGTTCGDRKWCVDGECVYNVSAPSVDPNCIFGDSSRPVYEGRKCDDVIRDKPYACYTKNNRDLCCASCAAAKNANNVGCEYGDKDNSCKSLSPLDELCPQPGIGELCCETCKGYASRPRGDGTVRNPINNNNNNDNNNDLNGNNNGVNNNQPQGNNNENGNTNNRDCGSGWTFNPTTMMCYHLTNEYRSGLRWSSAKDMCEKIGGTLATPKNAQQSRAVEEMARSADVDDRNVWIGLFQSGASYSPDINERRRGWLWVDGSTLYANEWSAWSDSEPDRGEIWVRMRQGRWLAIGTENDATYALCQKRFSSQTPVNPPPPSGQNFPPPIQRPAQPPPQNNGQTGACGSSEWTFSRDVNLCYLVSEFYPSGIRWSDAGSFCAEKGGALATPATSQQNAQMRNIILGKNADNENVWIGLYHDQGPQSTSLSDRRTGWRWVNGQTYLSNGWTGWESGEPGYGERWVRMRGGRWLAITDGRDGKYALCQKRPTL